MRPQFLVTIVCSIMLGYLITYLFHCRSTSEQFENYANPESSTYTRSNLFNDDPLLIDYKKTDWGKLLLKLSGKWVSANGQNTARIDDGMLHFYVAVDMPLLSHQTFLIREDSQFIRYGELYNFSAICDSFNKISIIKRNSYTQDLSTLILYREGSPRARSRKPLPEVEVPPKIQNILETISTIEAGDTKNIVMKSLHLNEFQGLELLGNQSDLGDSDLVYNLGIDDHWMLRIAFSQRLQETNKKRAVVNRVQVIRGYIDDFREGYEDIEKVIYPYYFSGKIITE